MTLEITEEDVDGSPLYKTNMSPVCFGKNLPLERSEVDGVPGAFLLKNVLSHDECKQLIDFTTSLGYSEATLRSGKMRKVILSVDDLNGERKCEIICE